MDKNIKWIKLLTSKKASCYIKPNMYRHESGFRCFEVGYLILGRDNKVDDKLVLGKYSDHIWNDKGFELSMDLTLDGYIRIWNNGGIVWWGSTEFTTSSASLELLSN